MNPYKQFVDDYSRVMSGAKNLPLGGFDPLPKPKVRDGAGSVVHFSPHPDDECLMGALLLRLQRDLGMTVINVPMTYGSNRERQPERKQELKGACAYLSFDILEVGEYGLPNVKPSQKLADPELWSQSVDKIAHVISSLSPRVIMIPHLGEFNATHQGTNAMVSDALAVQSSDFVCVVAEWEYWTPLEKSNALLEVSDQQMTDLLTAVSFHAGELRRNPQHANLPAWMQDNVRRGSELVGRPGGEAAPFKFATLYRMRKWCDSSLVDYLSDGVFLSNTDPIDSLLK